MHRPSFSPSNRIPSPRTSAAASVFCALLRRRRCSSDPSRKHQRRSPRKLRRQARRPITPPLHLLRSFPRPFCSSACLQAVQFRRHRRRALSAQPPSSRTTRVGSWPFPLHPRLVSKASRHLSVFHRYRSFPCAAHRLPPFCSRTIAATVVLPTRCVPIDEAPPRSTTEPPRRYPSCSRPSPCPVPPPVPRECRRRAVFRRSPSTTILPLSEEPGDATSRFAAAP